MRINSISFGSNKKSEVKTSIFYFNDTHGQSLNMGKLQSASNDFDENHKKDFLKVFSGDAAAGFDFNRLKLWVGFLNKLKIDVMALGNHDFDGGAENVVNAFKNAKFKMVMSNADKKTNPLIELIKDKKIVESTVIKRNGQEYGFIGTLPQDLPKVSTIALKVKDIEETKKALVKEIEKLKQKGVNKIILASHSGYKTDLELAKTVSGIDVIIGGHTHDIIEGVSPNNYVLSPAGEPVVITQAGRDNDLFGVLDVLFDENGVIRQAENNVKKVENYPNSKDINVLKNEYLGKTRNIGFLKSIDYPENTFEDPFVEFVADAVRNKANANVALIYTPGIRGKMLEGKISKRDIEERLIFNDRCFNVSVTEKELIDALNWSVKSLDEEKKRFIQASGLEYSINPDKTVKDVYINNGDILKIKLNSEKPSSDKHFNVVMEMFLLRGLMGFDMFKKENIVDDFGWTTVDATAEYINNFKNKPLNLKIQNRIKIDESLQNNKKLLFA